MSSVLNVISFSQRGKCVIAVKFTGKLCPERECFGVDHAVPAYAVGDIPFLLEHRHAGHIRARFIAVDHGNFALSKKRKLGLEIVLDRKSVV